ncbi:MAG: hypothetical protein ACD_75C02640G0001 [uncultured bacterium]|nr:MAG: hypothetical protein ACD_75C02640G0001 [uncultured bacterium]
MHTPNLTYSVRIYVLVLLGIVTLLILYSKESAEADDLQDQSETTIIMPGVRAKGKTVELNWTDDYLYASGSIRVHKGMPLFSVSIERTGGNHCCEYAYVSDPATFNTVFDSSSYGLEGGIELADLDGDGTVEISQNITDFHYYNGMCYAISPYVDVIFAYDKKLRKFVPANNRFPELWQNTLDEARNPPHSQKIIPDLGQAKDSTEFERIRIMESLAVAKAANLILAGYEKEAYTWLQRQFVPEEGRRVCEVLHDYLRSDSPYISSKRSRRKKRGRKIY